MSLSIKDEVIEIQGCVGNDAWRKEHKQKMDELMYSLRNYDSFTEEQWQFLETLEKKEWLEIIRIQNECLRQLTRYMM